MGLQWLWLLVSVMANETNAVISSFQLVFTRCGSGNYGPFVADATDDCCQIHDRCYDRIDGGVFGCSPKLVTYDWEELSNRQIQCTDEAGTCDRKACECDKAAVDCYERHRATYRADLVDVATRFGKDSSGRSKFCNP